MRLYKFLPQEHALADIALRRLKVARLCDLNDPFEFFAAEAADHEARRVLPDLKSKTDRRRGVLCFSDSWDNPVMWSHYADRHRGICLGFDVPDHAVKPIDYSAHRLPFRLDDAERTAVTPDMIEQLIYTKFEDWRYEQEYRIDFAVDPADEGEDLLFCDFGDDLRLREIILGPRCNVPLDRARALADRCGEGIEVLKARLAFTTFRVIADDRPRQGSAAGATPDAAS
jgi:hypothetical protein